MLEFYDAEKKKQKE